MLKGSLHVHSKYSDGEFTLPQVREIFVGTNCSFVCVSDHSEYFNEARLSAYISECRTLSDSAFCMIPGLEFSCRGRMHVLGYGATSLVKTDEPEAVIHHIAKQGGIAVLAHPKDESFQWIESFTVLPDGIETWNSKYDGRYAPRPGTFSLLQRLRERKPEMHAFYGQDLHWKKQYRGLFTYVNEDVLSSATILHALAAGEYWGSKDNLALPANGELPKILLQEFERRHRRSDSLRKLAKNIKKAADELGLSVPAPLKSHLRKLF